MEAGAQALPEVADFLTKHAQVKGQYKKKTIPSKVASRITRGPIFFKLVRVEYDKENGRLKLSEGEFTGKSIPDPTDRAMMGPELDDLLLEYTETILGMEKEEDYLSGEITDKIVKINLWTVYLRSLFL